MLSEKFLTKNDGSAIIEFAIVAPVFFLLFFGVLEFGLFMYHQIAIERIAVDVSRLTSVTTSNGQVANASGDCSATTTQIEYIKCTVRTEAAGLINGNQIQVQINTVAAGGTTVPDICLDDPANPSSAPATCTKYEDVNGNGVYNGLAASNTGNVGEVIQVLISYPWSVQFPILRDFFGSAANKGIVLIRASTIIKNEPF